MENVKDKTAIITGAGRGIGYSIAEELLRKGAKKIAIIDLPTSKGHEAVITLKEKFGNERVVYFPCDVTKTEDFKETFKEIVKVLGGLDILVNNAGLQDDHLIEEMFNVNVIALIHGSLMAVDYMGKHKGSKGGTILNMASMVGFIPVPNMLIYCASKFAVVAFSRCLQTFYDKTNVRVLTLCPAVTNTAMGKMVDNSAIYLDFVDKETIQDIWNFCKMQSCEHVANTAVDLIQKGENGTIFAVQDNESGYTVELPSYIRKGGSA